MRAEPDDIDSFEAIVFCIWFTIVLILGVNVLSAGRFLDPLVSMLLSVVGCVTGTVFFSR